MPKKVKRKKKESYSASYIAKISWGVVCLFWLFMYLAYYLKYETILVVLVLSYLLFGLVACIGIFIKIQRKYKMKSPSTEYRVIAVGGAIFVGVIMSILIYPLGVFIE